MILLFVTEFEKLELFQLWQHNANYLLAFYKNWIFIKLIAQQIQVIFPAKCLLGEWFLGSQEVKYFSSKASWQAFQKQANQCKNRKLVIKYWWVWRGLLIEKVRVYSNSNKNNPVMII